MTAELQYQIRSLPTAEFAELTSTHAKQIFPANQYCFMPRDHYTAAEAAKVAELKTSMGQPLRLNLAIFQDDELVGWSWGVQESAEVFYMVNSAVLPKFRGKGLYSKLVSAMTEAATDLGFQIIYSRHSATNNAVLVPKLKKGFYISSFELSDQYGVLVHLRWYRNPLRRKVFEFRAGGHEVDKDIKGIFNLDDASPTKQGSIS